MKRVSVRVPLSRLAETQERLAHVPGTVGQVFSSFYLFFLQQTSYNTSETEKYMQQRRKTSIILTDDPQLTYTMTHKLNTFLCTQGNLVNP